MVTKSWHELFVEILEKTDSQETFAEDEIQIVTKKRRKRGMYFLGDNFKGIYFTQREAECMMQLLQGKSFSGAAEKLNLSPRTVEFYVKNMRKKLNCDSKFELIAQVRDSDFLNNFNVSDKKS
ncbi:MAG: helix-turn-helix transcriptional regulator [Gammaproteobacteria bacterium]|nr:helix-turn-helix transcriptional regulator [Gammaproteobacteria bacterium]